VEPADFSGDRLMYLDFGSWWTWIGLLVAIGVVYDLAYASGHRRGEAAAAARIAGLERELQDKGDCPHEDEDGYCPMCAADEEG
jgi:hypothetical protein